MIQYKKVGINKAIFFLSLLSICIISWLIQNQILLNLDVSWLTEASKRMLAGGNYEKDFFENNPPLILYLYTIPAFISSYFKLHVTWVIHAYVTLIALCSLFICFSLLKKILSYDHPKAQIILNLSLAILFLILPVYDFGQREHLLVLLTTPYILLMVLSLENKKIILIWRILIGIFAGIGFAIKPYFLFPLLFLEIYFVAKNRHVFSIFRAETLAVGCIMLSYGFVIYFFHYYYVSRLVPYAWPLWPLMAKTPWELVIFSADAIYCLMILLLASLLPKKSNSHLIQILIIACCGFLVSAVIQQTLAKYHFYPAICFATFIIMIELITMFSKNKVIDKNFIIYSGIILIGYNFLFYHSVGSIAIYSPIVFISFFMGIFTIFLYLNTRFNKMTDGLKTLATLAFIFGISFWYLYILNRSNFYNYSFTLATIFILLLFHCYFIFKNMPKKLFMHLMLFFAMMLLLHPFCRTYLFYEYNVDLKTRAQNLTNYIGHNAENKPIYFLTTDLRQTFPETIDARAIYASRFSYLWMLSPLIIEEKLAKTSLELAKLQTKKNFLINMIAEDITQKKPHLIFVDVGNKKNGFFFYKKLRYRYRNNYFSFDYLNEFLKNENFKSAWKSYSYVTTITDNSTLSFPLYTLAVYQRI